MGSIVELFKYDRYHFHRCIEINAAFIKYDIIFDCPMCTKVIGLKFLKERLDVVTSILSFFNLI